MGILMCCELSYTWLVELVKLVRVDMGVCGGGFENQPMVWQRRRFRCVGVDATIA